MKPYEQPAKKARRGDQPSGHDGSGRKHPFYRACSGRPTEVVFRAGGKRQSKTPYQPEPDSDEFFTDEENDEDEVVFNDEPVKK